MKALKEILKSIVYRCNKLFLVLFRNRIILSFVNYLAKRNRINLNWAALAEKKFGCFIWKKKCEEQNLGDYLAVPIFEYMTKRFGLDPNKKVKKTIHLYTIGSLILLGYQDAVVWGSGILQEEPKGFKWKRSKCRKLDIRCVRGPETMRRLQENDYDVSKCLIGDPGVLMPLIYQPKGGEKKEYSVILHMSVNEENTENKINILTADWQDTIDQIYNSRLVISSSLHGIILAEAYGVPAILLDKLEFADRFKYDDYYYSTGRYEYPVCHSIEEALNIPIPEVPDLSRLQQNLLNSFPVDLWQ